MGDRANVRVQDADGHVYLYTHWGGTNLPHVVQMALQRKQRWDDPAYLARIVFCEMVKGDVEGETGFGIYYDIVDNEHPILVLDCHNTIVRFMAWNWQEQTIANAIATWAFQDYIKLDPETINMMWTGVANP